MPLPQPVPRISYPDDPPEKPRQVFYAELALWLWTIWTCAYGLYQTAPQITEIEDQLVPLQGLVAISPQTLWQVMYAAYAAIAVASIWVIVGINRGKHWARSSLWWGFILQFLMEAAPPYHGVREVLTEIPDLGLQIYALVLLYTKPGKGWFK